MSMIFNPASGRPQVFSHGGGTQGSAIAALIVTGRLPKPDVCIIADTGREASQTWEYYEQITRPALEAVGVPCHRIPHAFKAGDPGYNTIDLMTGANNDMIAVPMFTDHSGEQGQLPKYCSNEWKKRPIERFLKRELGIHEADVWIGFSVDEATTRAKYNPSEKLRNVYPLIEYGISRADCIALVQELGWPTPPRSSCWMCPYRSKSEWLDLKDNWPADFQAAVQLERELRRGDPHVFFHRSLRPLDRVDWAVEPDERYEPGCQSGLCFT